jgi:flagellar biosynthetic protein FlhB
MLLAIASNAARLYLCQTRPDLSRIDPLKGFGRLFSLTNLVRLAFGIFKVAIVAGVAYASLKGHRDEILAASGMALPEMAAFLVDLLLSTALKVALALLLLAILDFGFQWWKQEQDMRMTTQEVREEMKNLQGDPQVISRRRACSGSWSSIGSSTVPRRRRHHQSTRLAVAIQYDPETMSAPVVVAKGAGVMAQRIRKLALEHGIPIVEKKPLAQALFKEVDINHPVPHQMYSAVAEILAYVYQLKGKSLPTVR